LHNIKELLHKTTEFFAKHNIENPRLDAEVLLADLLGVERIDLYVKFDYPLTAEELTTFRQRVKKRVQHYPVAYIIGVKEFMSLEFKIEPGVLIPRPETELLVEEVINYCEDNDLAEPNIVDVGTGSGVIAISLGYYLKKARVLGIDISENAVQIARHNLQKHELEERVSIVRGNLLDGLIAKKVTNVDIIVSNPPYISNAEMEILAQEVKQEPVLALQAGEKGLDYYEELLGQATKVIKSAGKIFLEIGSKQAGAVQNICKKYGWSDIIVKKDYAGHDRLIIASWPVKKEEVEKNDLGNRNS